MEEAIVITFAEGDGGYTVSIDEFGVSVTSKSYLESLRRLIEHFDVKEKCFRNLDADLLSDEGIVEKDKIMNRRFLRFLYDIVDTSCGGVSFLENTFSKEL